MKTFIIKSSRLKANMTCPPYHPAGVAVFLTDSYTKFTMPDGKTKDLREKPGETSWAAAEKHLPENVGDKPLELVLVELNTKPAKTK